VASVYKRCAQRYTRRQIHMSVSRQTIQNSTQGKERHSSGYGFCSTLILDPPRNATVVCTGMGESITVSHKN
jgi:TPP-dependent indolepyruvate ferredoxin oxidoreductase alpha subunit